MTTNKSTDKRKATMKWMLPKWSNDSGFVDNFIQKVCLDAFTCNVNCDILDCYSVKVKYDEEK